jgi:hypothetical protein
MMYLEREESDNNRGIRRKKMKKRTLLGMGAGLLALAAVACSNDRDTTGQGGNPGDGWRVAFDNLAVGYVLGVGSDGVMRLDTLGTATFLTRHGGPAERGDEIAIDFNGRRSVRVHQLSTALPSCSQGGATAGVAPGYEDEPADRRAIVLFSPEQTRSLCF